MNRTQYLFQILLICIVVLNPSCKKEESPSCESVILDIDFKANDSVFNYNTVYEINGVHVEFSDLRFYLSDVTISDGNGASQLMKEAVLIDAGANSEIVTLGSTEMKTVQNMQMLLGVNETANAADPTLAASPLNNASMTWGWNPGAGYKFIKIELTIDTDNDGIPDEASSIHCAGNEVARDMDLNFNASAAAGEIKLELTADVLSFFEDIDLLNLNGTHGSSPLTNTVANNVAVSFVTE